MADHSWTPPVPHRATFDLLPFDTPGGYSLCHLSCPHSENRDPNNSVDAWSVAWLCKHMNTVRPSWAAVTKGKGVRKRKKIHNKQKGGKWKRREIKVCESRQLWLASQTGPTLFTWCIYVQTHRVSCADITVVAQEHHVVPCGHISFVRAVWPPRGRMRGDAHRFFIEAT